MKSLKIVSLVAFTVLFSFAADAQRDKSKRKSPPAQVMQEVNGKTITIDYSKPSKRGRVIFGELVPFGEVWRTGANESSWVEFSEEVTIQGEKLAAGKYGLFTIPGENEWTIIFNSNSSGWGKNSYSESNDELRVTAESRNIEAVDQFDIQISEEGEVTLAWDETQVTFTVK